MPAPATLPSDRKPVVSIGIIAWNEEEIVGAALESLLGQDIFARLAARGQQAEILCVVNGCTDRTPEIAREHLEHRLDERFPGGAVTARVVELAERGKLNAWNRFVHDLSAREAGVLILMDADILFREHGTLWSMYKHLVTHPSVTVTVDEPVKDISCLPVRGLRARLSRQGSHRGKPLPGYMCGQLYAIRAATARNIYLPKDLGAVDDGYIKAVVCTDFFTHPVVPGRIVCAPDASHLFQAYTAVGDILRNRKRQMIGQTMIHVLVDGYLRHLPFEERRRLGALVRAHEENDPAWLKRRLADHLYRSRFFWNLYPGMLSARLRRWRGLTWSQKVACLPAIGADMVASLIGAWQAHRDLRRGATDYWPDTRSGSLASMAPAAGGRRSLGAIPATPG